MYATRFAKTKRNSATISDVIVREIFRFCAHSSVSGMAAVLPTDARSCSQRLWIPTILPKSNVYDKHFKLVLTKPAVHLTGERWIKTFPNQS